MIEEFRSFSCSSKTIPWRLTCGGLRSICFTVAVGSMAEKLNKRRVRLSRGYAYGLRIGGSIWRDSVPGTDPRDTPIPTKRHGGYDRSHTLRVAVQPVRGGSYVCGIGG